MDFIKTFLLVAPEIQDKNSFRSFSWPDIHWKILTNKILVNGLFKVTIQESKVDL